MSEIYVALDLEATGMDPERDEIIEIAAIKFRDDRVLDRWETLVRPRATVPLSITSLTGLTMRHLRQAPPFSAVASRLREFVRNHPIVGQSPEFDLQMLAAAGLALQNPVYDTFQLATILLPDLPAYSLASIAARLGISVNQQHRAMADVETTMAVFLGLRDLLLEYDPETLRRLADYARSAGLPVARLFDEVHRELTGQGAGGLADLLAERLRAALPGVSHAPEAVFLLQRDRPERLEPTGRARPIDLARLRAWYGQDGPLARSFPAYEARAQQVQMAEAVAETLNRGGQLLVEAGTGTGKSLAYLLPAVLHAVERGETVVISTNTIALQDQLFNKDLPLLRRALEEAARRDPELAPAAAFRATVLKGRSNYLCLRRWFLRQREPARSPAEALLYAKITAWLPQTNTGDRAELHLSPDEQAVWAQLAEEEGACVPGRCVFHRRNQCFLFRARAEAEAAHIVIVNHALLLSDMLADNRVLPPYRHLVIDEAHNLEDEATAQLGFRLTQEQVRDLFRRSLSLDSLGRFSGVLGELWQALADVPARRARDLAQDLHARIEGLLPTVERGIQQVERLFTQLGDFALRYQVDQGSYERQVRLTAAVRHDPAWDLVEEAAEDVAIELRGLLGALSWTLTRLGDLAGDELPSQDDLVTELDLLVRVGHELHDRLVETVAAPSPERVYWLSLNPSTGQVALNMAPLDVSGPLREHLFSRCDSVVLTSATLTIEGSFGYIRERLGLPEARELLVPSPFDYASSTLLCVAEDLPEPGEPGYQRQLNEVLVPLLRATRGRAMVLFTSHSALQSTYRAIKRPLETAGILVLGQRIDGSPRQLVERLKSRPETVVLGTNSVWEGVDIPGEALSVLVIAKLPFSVPTDPVFAARSEQFADPFQEYAVPQAVLRLKQGFGRLIRSRTDYGVCVVLDRRILSRRYGRTFLRSLPDCRLEVTTLAELPSKASEWLHRRQETFLATSPAGEEA
ncbi:exonuclease domain-containing protein [Thermomicrobiaceae bacterium CFH 74404]|uniref:3'-5' exonuclease DinG n=1 Tax=Thermalbibacter longus TaxID=2951981 RepID=A0AA41WCB6_9BACT|nr:helicase C-terminal domain-containing protein [Thermalbibacter longus]MCM8748358.1 exonuclease domain-containing protein [Thermalbibacter longus]